MNYKETLFFVARSLTVNHEKHNYEFVRNQIQDKKVDWDNVVQLSTQHYVFPALYCNLKRAELLQDIPTDLVEYMEHITQLNRERNTQILEQAKEINSLLKKNSIEPIFLKGTGFLLQNFYHDIGERMVGDIDFIVPYIDYENAARILESKGYKSYWKKKYKYPQFKHYDRLVKEGLTAAVEIHKELVKEGHHQNFNYQMISKNIDETSSEKVMSYGNQLCLSIIAKQINDNGQFFDDIALRNAYDVFLLSQKTDSLKSIEDLKDIFNPLNNFLAICNQTLNVKSIKFKENEESSKAIEHFHKIIENPTYRKQHYNRTARKLFFKARSKFILQAFTRKENRIWMYNRFLDKEWQREKLIQLKLAKPKS